jgi:hypothetical protein
MGSPEFDEFGTKMLYLSTGQFVDMKVGGDPAGNGQRYNANHKFENYMMIGYFKTGKDQEQIEMKTDGPNHGSCNRSGDFPDSQLPNCMWYEPQIHVDGQILLGGEWWHNDNRSGLRMDFHEDVQGGISEQWIGYAVIAYWNPQGQRVIEQWCCKNPFDSNGKPTNDWKMNLRSSETGDGKMFPKKHNKINITFPRHLPIDFDPKGKVPPRGLEAEIRMHGEHEGHQKPDGTDMKWCRVYEIIPPS